MLGGVSLKHVMVYVADLLRKPGVQVLIVKAAGVGLSFVMFVVIARLTEAAEYGRFAFLFALGSFGGAVARAGQQTLVLRYLPEYEVGGRTDAAKGLLVTGSRWLLSAAAMVIALILLAAVGTRWMEVSIPASVVGLAALLVVPLALADYFCSIMRVHGFVLAALLPRDVAWRLGAILGAGALAWALARSLTAAEAFVVVAGVLAFVVSAQAIQLVRKLPVSIRRAAATRDDLTRWRRSSLWLWLASSALVALPHLSVVIVGLFLRPVEIGAFFAAQKVALLLSLPLVAANFIGAPLISRSWALGDREDTQRVCRTTVSGLIIPSVAGFLLIALASAHLLRLFDPAFAIAGTALIILAVGELVNALCGPSGFLMTMTGHEREQVRILCIGQGSGLLATAFGAYAFGLNGAAAGVAFGAILWNFLTWMKATRSLGVDPTVLSLLPGSRR